MDKKTLYGHAVAICNLPGCGRRHTRIFGWMACGFGIIKIHFEDAKHVRRIAKSKVLLCAKLCEIVCALWMVSTHLNILNIIPKVYPVSPLHTYGLIII